MEKFIDLHAHTTASDGTYTPEALVDLAASKGLAALAISDHDTTAAIEKAALYALNSHPNLEIIPAIEYSASSDVCISDIHILGYYIDPNDEHMTKGLKTIVSGRYERNERMVDAMIRAGMPITLEDVSSQSDKGVITRAHIARAMVHKGIVKKMNQAFEKYIGDGKPFYRERYKATPEEAIKTITAAGGVPVLAHPILYKLKVLELRALVKELTVYGLKGIEGIYTTYKTHETQLIRSIAKENGLIVTGGSDFHGDNKPGIDLGTGWGNLKVPYSVRDELYKAHLEIKRVAN